jgi:hypothetical protein
MKPSISRERALGLLKKQKEHIPGLQRQKRFCPDFKKWKRDTEVVIGKIFGEESKAQTDFDAIHYSLGIFSSGTPDFEFQAAYVGGLAAAEALLDSCVSEIEEFWDEGAAGTKPDPLHLVSHLLSRFHAVARQLRVRHAARPTLNISDEYDVQDLLHALLKLSFNDIRPEETTPSYAGGASRMDFLLKDEQTVVEVKRTRDGLEQKEVGDQLLVDIQRYRAHPDCKRLICFVYDPEGRIGNPAGLEKDLSREIDGLSVHVLIHPR